MQNVKTKISKLKSLFIKEQKVLLDVLSTMAKSDGKASGISDDFDAYLAYNRLLGMQLQLVSRLQNQQIKKQELLLDCDVRINSVQQEKNDENQIHIDNFVSATPVLQQDETTDEAANQKPSDVRTQNIR
ncbi:MAG: hypothetical protein ACI4MI_00370 [Christensenellales bacterium]